LQGDPYSLDRLRDIVQPAPVSWWPPAPFWYGVIVLAAAWLGYGLVLAAHRWIHNAYRRQALRELAMIEDAANQDGPQVEHLSNVSEILKRTALVSFQREKVASLSGEAWLRFLTETCDQVDFMKQPNRCLGSASFEPQVAGTVNLEQIVRDARTWIVGHRSEASP
jgi:hypothetical protein